MKDIVLETPAGSKEAPSEYGYDDLRALMSRQTGDEKHDGAATSTLDRLLSDVVIKRNAYG